MALDPRIRRELAQTGRLWGLAFVCAAVGAGTVWSSDSVRSGVIAFGVCVAVLGPLLYLYERRTRPPSRP